MTTLEKVRDLIAELSPGEKAQTLQWLVHDLGHTFPGIEQTPGVAGGEPCLIRTRIPVWLLVQARVLGSSESEISHIASAARRRSQQRLDILRRPQSGDRSANC